MYCRLESAHGQSFGILIGSDCSIAYDRVIHIRGGLEYLDPHVIDHADDVFDLLRLHDAIGQVIIDLSIGKETLFLSLCDQLLEL